MTTALNSERGQLAQKILLEMVSGLVASKSPLDRYVADPDIAAEWAIRIADRLIAGLEKSAPKQEVNEVCGRVTVFREPYERLSSLHACSLPLGHSGDCAPIVRFGGAPKQSGPTISPTGAPRPDGGVTAEVQGRCGAAVDIGYSQEKMRMLTKHCILHPGHLGSCKTSIERGRP